MCVYRCAKLYLKKILKMSSKCSLKSFEFPKKYVYKYVNAYIQLMITTDRQLGPYIILDLIHKICEINE